MGLLIWGLWSLHGLPGFLDFLKIYAELCVSFSGEYKIGSNMFKEVCKPKEPLLYLHMILMTEYYLFHRFKKMHLISLSYISYLKWYACGAFILARNKYCKWLYAPSSLIHFVFSKLFLKNRNKAYWFLGLNLSQ